MKPTPDTASAAAAAPSIAQLLADDRATRAAVAAVPLKDTLQAMHEVFTSAALTEALGDIDLLRRHLPDTEALKLQVGQIMQGVTGLRTVCGQRLEALVKAEALPPA